MPKIEIEDGLTLRFPGRDASFHEGVEIGMLATLMATGQPEIVRTISAAALEQAQALAGGLGYRAGDVRPLGADRLSLTLVRRGCRPRLRVVATGAEAGGAAAQRG